MSKTYLLAIESPPSSPDIDDIPLTPLPIVLSLDTPHDLPHVSTFRLNQPSTILGALGRNRKLDISQSIWDRMPSALGIKMSDEDSVERILGRKYKPEHINSIYVHPPTPERETPESPRINLVPLQVLPEVRSPPKRNLAMAADSLQLTLRRGRRPRLFGFTEIPDSSSSSRNSSANNSKNNSPERTPVSAPPRGPVRTQSETHLPTLPRKRETGLKLDFTGIVPINSQPGTPSAKLIRKKSGELVKPALKYSGPLTACGTPIGEPSPRFETKSLPSTPSFPKYVHFDSQLERVKLFNKDHKPQVVSRDGSPQCTTSEGEEFPFPSTDEESEKILQIKLPNFPTSHPPDSDLHLESLYLDDDRKSLRGVVVVRNFSFSKWVAIRFTFDWWQTTSEVSASHKESIKGGEFDRFAFQVKLGDMMAKIEERTLFLCVRYNSEGREIWDSNGGQNYQVNFERSAGKSRGKAVGRQWIVKGKEDDRMADLREKLNRLTAEDDLQPQLSPNRSSMKWASPTSSPLKGVTDLPSLSSRYDFNTALKGSPEVRNTELPGLLFRPGMDYYSPVYEDVFAPVESKIPTPLPIPDLTVQGPSPPPPESPKTRPALIRSTTSPAKLISTLPTSPQSPSPPLLSESSSSTEPSDSPKSPPEVGLSRFAESRVRGSDDSMASYSNFIEQFCWGGSNLTPSTTAEPRRTHSSSTLDEYFAHSSGSGFTTPRPLLSQTYTQYSPVGSPGMIWKRGKEDDAGMTRAGLGGINGFGGVGGNVSPPVRVGI